MTEHGRVSVPVKSACRLWCKSPDTIRRWIKAGKIEGEKDPGGLEEFVFGRSLCYFFFKFSAISSKALTSRSLSEGAGGLIELTTMLRGAITASATPDKKLATGSFAMMFSFCLGYNLFYYLMLLCFSASLLLVSRLIFGYGCDGAGHAAVCMARDGAPIICTVGAPRSGGGRACGGLPELAQGWRERRPGESLHNARVIVFLRMICVVRENV